VKTHVRSCNLGSLVENRFSATQILISRKRRGVRSRFLYAGIATAFCPRAIAEWRHAAIRMSKSANPLALTRLAEATASTYPGRAARRGAMRRNYSPANLLPRLETPKKSFSGTGFSFVGAARFENETVARTTSRVAD